MEHLPPRAGVDVIAPEGMPVTDITAAVPPTPGVVIEVADPVAGTSGVYRSRNLESPLDGGQEFSADPIARVRAMARPAGSLATARGVAMLAEANYVDASRRGQLYMAHMAEQQALQELQRAQNHRQMYAADESSSKTSKRQPDKKKPDSQWPPQDDLLKYLHRRSLQGPRQRANLN